MKIAFYAPYDFRAVGGAERFVLFFCRSLALAGCEVSLFGGHVPELEGVRCFDAFSGGFSGKFDICFTQAIYGFGGLPEADIYVHRYNGTTWGNLLARPHLFLHPRFWWWLFSELRSARDKHGYIFVSKCAEREMKMLGCRGKAIILPGGGGWEKDRFSGTKDNEALRLLFCGRSHDKVKRFDLIRTAFLQARAKMPEISLYVAGGQASQKSSDGIHYMGSLSDAEMKPLLQSCHVQINASFYEGFSLSLSEGIFQGG
jgi:glycosyltransferase involved in cell wall biosynthesis